MKSMHKKPTLRKAFTLIEMLIVMSIIGLLAALTLGISSSVMRNSEIRQTENALKVLSMALQEWELEMGRTITFNGVDSDVYDYDIDMSGGSIGYPGFGAQGVDNGVMSQEMKLRNVTLVEVLSDGESSKDVLSKIETDLVIKDALGMMFIIDPWGNPLGVVFPGKYFIDVFPSGNNMFAQDSSGDLTVRDDVEDGLGSCINQRPYFVSAGPDGLWGYRFQAGDGPISSDPTIMELWNATLDNIYSYKPYIVEGAR